MTEAGEKTRIIALAQPLLHREGLSQSELFQKYADLTLSDDREQSQLFRLLALLTQKPTDTDSHMFSAVNRVPSCGNYYQFFKWLGEVYSPPERDAADADGRAFDFLRTEKIPEFLESIRASRPENSWIVSVYAGAFTTVCFKDWLAAAKDLLNSDLLSESDANLIRILCGDREACRVFERTFLDKLWSDIWCGMTKIKCGGSAEFKLSSPKKEGWFADAAWSAVQRGLAKLPGNALYPLTFRVCVACVLGNPSEDLLLAYIDTLVEKRMLGMVVVYAAMAPSEGPVRLLAEVLSCLPEPDEKPLDIARRFNIDPIDVTSAVVERLLCEKEDIFQGEMEPDELARRRMAALEWMERLQGCNAEQSDKVRRMLRRLVLDGEIEWASKLFTDPKFEAAFADPGFKRERHCWEVFFDAEAAYSDWKNQKCNSSDAILKLKAVMEYPGGWMRRCGQNVTKDLGMYCIPRIARQLHHVLMAEKQVDAALGIAALVCDNGKMLEEYFTRDALKRFLIDVCKSAAIAKYSI